MTGMPKNKSKQQGAKAAVGDAHNDFDKMLAEVTAADSEVSADVPASTATTASSTSSSSSKSSRSRSSRSSSSSSSSGRTGAPRLQASEMEIFGACERGDIAQLRRWGREGVRVKNADLLVNAILDEVSSDILRCLVKELGADINGARLSDGVTPLYVAAQTRNLALVRCLVKEHGADVNQAANDGATPLCIAVQEGHLAVVRCMVKELGADVNRARPDGVTSLMIAARFQNDAVVAFLIKYGANVQVAAPSFGTAAEISRRYGAPAQQTQFLE
jgi:hypothetical protein